MSGHTYTHTHIHTHTHTYTHDNYYNPRCAHAHRGLMKALRCKPLAQFAYNYSINVLSKCSSIISHRSSKVDRHIDPRRSTHRSSIFEAGHIDLRKSSKVDISIIDLQKSTHRSSKVDTSIFKDRRQKYRTDNLSPNIVHNGAP